MIYFVRAGNSVKIGVVNSRHTMDTRLGELQCGSSLVLSVLGTMDGDFSTESDLHARFANERYLGEWFHLTPAIADFIEANCRPYITLTDRSNLVRVSQRPAPVTQRMITSAVSTRNDDPDRDEMIRAFISGCVQSGGKCKTSDLYEKFAEFCHRHNRHIDVPSQKLLTAFLFNAGFIRFKRSTIFWRVTVSLPQEEEMLTEAVLAS